MNQRLKDIMLAHGLHKHISEDCQHRMEFLYDVVVKECASVIEDAVDQREPASTYVDKIKQHFGVK